LPVIDFYIQGLDTPTPYIQLQGTILKGRHDMLLGTELIFTDDKGANLYIYQVMKSNTFPLRSS